jgi:hypothetical protein
MSMRMNPRGLVCAVAPLLAAVAVLADGTAAFGAGPLYAASVAAPICSLPLQSSSTTTVTTTSVSLSDAYRGVSSFFNIREANANVDAGQWELELNFGWSTSSGESDEFEMSQSLKYGITDQVYFEVEVEEPDIGNGGGSGAGDINLELFWQLVEENGDAPAFALSLKGRFPTGDGSSGIDGRLNGIITKSLTDEFRFHFQGYVMSADGSSGDIDYDRENFQWGLGPGFDYLVTDGTLIGLNYLYRNNDNEDEDDQHIVELGLVQELGESGGVEHTLKLAVDAGVDGRDSTPNFGAKIQWGIEW